MKKVCVFLCILLLCVSVFAQTESDFTVGLTSNGTGVVIEHYIGTVVNVKIPATIQGMPVTEIGEDAFNGIKAKIVSMELPNGITKIGRQAFFAQKVLTSVKLPDTLIIIGARAFSDCAALTSLVIPKSVTIIGESTFMGCTKLKTINLPDTLTSIGGGAFNGSGIESIKWPASVNSIAAESSFYLGMFESCENLKSIVIPEGVTSIGDNAFGNCQSLVSIALPSTIERIGDNAFIYCANLTDVIIPDSVKTISGIGSAFSGCSKLKLASQAAIKKRDNTGNL